MVNDSVKYDTMKLGARGVINGDVEAEAQQRMVLVEWLNHEVPHFYLSVKASVEELRASLLDGIVLNHILNKLKPSFIYEGVDSNLSPESKVQRIKRFIAAMAKMGLPSFELSDLEKGSMKPVLDCLLALKAQSLPQLGHTVSMAGEDRQKVLSDSKFLRALHSPVASESSAALLHSGPKFHEVFQLKQGLYADLPATKISEMMKSNSLDNAPTQSLLSVVNGILDESIERRNAEIPQRVACLLRKVVQEIDRRISSQAENLRTQSNLFKAREEKYQSRIRVLETLAAGTNEESENIMNQLRHIKFEKNKMEEKMNREEEGFARLKREKDQVNLEMSALKQELEAAKKSYELRNQELEAQSELVKSLLERKLKEQQQLLDNSKNKVKELEVNAESKIQKWSRKEHAYEDLMNAHILALQDLGHSSEAIKQELLKIQKSYFEELNSLGQKLKGVAEEAPKYHDALLENCKLFNELQDLKGNIRVYCRIRPFLPTEMKKETVIENIGENGELVIINPSKPGKDGQRSFKFNKVLGPTATQEEIFSDTQPLIRTVLDGYNVCIFAYGQTGSGKTHTMAGPEGATKESWGVNYRALDDLFQISEDRNNYFQYEIAVQMVEIYNEQVRDLLSSDSSQKKYPFLILHFTHEWILCFSFQFFVFLNLRTLGILSTSHPHGLAVPDASILPVRSTSDVIEMMRIGHTNRAVGATAMNERSSRSHSIVTVHVQGTDLKTGSATRGNLHLVDLAGSERVDRSESTGDRLREAQHINKSLSALGDVIFALAQKSPHVPYRNSKLTQVLQSSLGGRAKTLMFVQINPDAASYSETLSSLKFAERVSAVELGAARSNKESRDSRELMEQVESLKDVIAKKDEEIERLLLLKDPRSVHPAVKRSISSLRYGSLSTYRNSIGDTPPRSPKLSSGKRSGLFQKAASDQDNCSESSDKQSDAGSQQSLDDVKYKLGIFRPSKSMNNSKHQKASPRQSKLSGGRNISTDDDIVGFGDADNEEKLSEISDGDLSLGTEIDGSFEAKLLMKDPIQHEPSELTMEMSKTASKISQRSRVQGKTSSPRLSQINTTSRGTTGVRKSAGGSFSPVAPVQRRQ
ncbi:hypothetical protein Nepgr_005788 [Nepenthes gracilis]|uniref:Uncharacterized protein n=1 Tax=Nepenthes gracilis TaxID=150966 RepID=A0AAD3S3V1_NEPGR|nr:hypothetical protein Nepgr_005788 [Nepenthes gracilis]